MFDQYFVYGDLNLSDDSRSTARLTVRVRRSVRTRIVGYTQRALERHVWQICYKIPAFLQLSTTCWHFWELMLPTLCHANKCTTFHRLLYCSIRTHFGQVAYFKCSMFGVIKLITHEDRAISRLVACPRDGDPDWNIDDARAAGEGIINISVRSTSPRAGH